MLPDWASLSFIVRVNIGLGGWTILGRVSEHINIIGYWLTNKPKCAYTASNQSSSIYKFDGKRSVLTLKMCITHVEVQISIFLKDAGLLYYIQYERLV